MKNALKIIIKTLFFVILIILVILSIIFAYYYVKVSSKYRELNFDKDKLITATSYAEILDNNDFVLSNASINGRNTVSFNEIPQHTINAFISIEDKNFYKHNGINYKRILKSLLVNIKSGYAKEGASTISQQLIKNTHLSNEKTIERKLKEYLLTRKLEKKFTKDEILETYLNVIYFGNSCFGIENASKYYFNKTTSELNIGESAVLAGLIKSPKLYSPITAKKKCTERRNLVLKEMLDDKYITEEQFKQETQKEIEIAKNDFNNTIERTSLSLATKEINLSEKELVNSNLKIKTYINSQLQHYIDSLDLTLFSYDNFMPEYAIIVENNQTGGIEALRTSLNVNIEEMLRQPASCLKPFLVYAPNFEDGKINLLTQLDDNKTNISGFNPNNAGNQYKGKISVREAISSSSNVCATKLLNYYGINKAKKFASKFGFRFDKKDNHLALALGSLYNGCDLLTLTNAYATLANYGVKPNINLINNITGQNDIVIYKNPINDEQILSKETCFFITQALQSCSQNGTAKKLKDFSNYVASKTGTNGAYNSNKNTDAYCISYSKKHTVCVWFGVKNNDSPLLPQNYNGGNQPTYISKLIWEYLKPSEPFSPPENIIKLDIDKINYNENGTIKLAIKNTPERYIIKEYFNKNYAPTIYATTFKITEKPVLHAKVKNNNVELTFEADKFTKYYLYKKTRDTETLLDTIENYNKNKYTYNDNKLSPNFYEYYIVAEKNNKLQSDIIKILIE